MINTIKNKLKNYNPYIIGSQNMRISSILIPIVKKDNVYHILFQVRSKNLRFQPNEISFPGGGVNPNETPYEAVIRETIEELGIKKTDLEVISEIDLLVTHSNMIIHPFIGYLDSLDNLNINEDEVDHVFLVPISYLLDFSPSEYKHEVKIVPADDFPYELIPNKENYKFISGYDSTIFYEYKDYVIWGITAKILNNFLNFISS